MKARHYVDKLIELKDEKSSLFTASAEAKLKQIDKNLHKTRVRMLGIPKKLVIQRVTSELETFFEANSEIFSPDASEKNRKLWTNIYIQNIVQILTSSEYNKQLTLYLTSLFNKKNYEALYYIQKKYRAGRIAYRDSMDQKALAEYDRAWLEIITPPHQPLAKLRDLDNLNSKNDDNRLSNLLTGIIVFVVLGYSVN